MRKRRHWFAAPFVVTVALAPGCSSPDKVPEPERRPDLPPGTQASWWVMARGSACIANEPMSCPPKVMCNPPPPQDVECPPMATDTTSVRLIKRADGTCAVLPDGCMTDACTQGPTPCPIDWDEMLPTLQWAVNTVDGTCQASPASRTGMRSPLAAVTIECPLPEGHGFIERATPTAPCVACLQGSCDPATATKVACPPESPMPKVP